MNYHEQNLYNSVSYYYYVLVERGCEVVEYFVEQMGHVSFFCILTSGIAQIRYTPPGFVRVPVLISIE